VIATITATRIATATRKAAVTGLRISLNDPATSGLCLRITARGVRTWSWLGRDAHGRVRRFGLGRYPHIGLREARRRARQMADEVGRGADPVRDARTLRALTKAPVGHTLADLLDLYGRQVGDSIKSWGIQTRRQIERVFCSHLATPLSALTVGALQMTADSYAAKHSASFAVRCLSPVLRWAVAPGRAYVSRDLLDLRAPASRRSRDRVLSRDELAALLPTLRASDSPYADAMHLVLLTACRKGEVTAARWRDIDLDTATWTLPDTKNGMQHVVPLSRQAVALLKARRPERAHSAGLAFTSKGMALNNWSHATAQLQQASGTVGWTRHDLRRTCATMLGEMGVMPDIVEATLNHVSIRSPLAATYNRSRYRPQVAAALQRLADALDSIEYGGGDVVVLPARG
jgi:integrase